MTLDEAIKRCNKISLEALSEIEDLVGLSDHYNIKEWQTIRENHQQLASWLTELKELREQIRKAKPMILDYSYTVEVMCNRIKNTMGCENCTYCNEETHDCEVRTYIAKTRAFAKGGKNDA